jgi:hypothetical protein
MTGVSRVVSSLENNHFHVPCNAVNKSQADSSQSKALPHHCVLEKLQLRQLRACRPNSLYLPASALTVTLGGPWWKTTVHIALAALIDRDNGGA